VIKDRRVLRRLGFLQRRSSDTASEEVDPHAPTQVDNTAANAGTSPGSSGSAGSAAAAASVSIIPNKEVALRIAS
jgi:hypothetical protein